MSDASATASQHFDDAASETRGFAWSTGPEPHAARRREMLAKYPEIRTLYGPCPRTKYVCTALVVAQLALAYLLRDAPWWLMLLVAYGVGGVLSQALLLAIHELSHNLGFKKAWHNRVFAVFINLPIGVPVAETFRYYHRLHHQQQGVAGVDTDLPTEFEARFARTAPRKVLWLLLQGVAYGLRPLLVHPKRPSATELANLVLQFSFNGLVWYLWGLQAFLYLPLSALIVMGLHPIAGHYISEHYVFRPGQETYSYYGPLNRLTFNVGYHNEHHDFPYVSGSQLPRLRRLAAEYYDDLMHHESWTATLWRYVREPRIGGYSRIKRAGRTGSQGVGL